MGRLDRDLHIRFDRRFQLTHAAVGAASNLFLGESGKPTLHEIDPGGAGRGEVHVKARAFGQPRADGRCLVSAVVLEIQVDVQRRRHALTDGVQKLPELRTAVTTMAFSDDCTSLDVEGSKQ
jgi:hypothetical protein